MQSGFTVIFLRKILNNGYLLTYTKAPYMGFHRLSLAWKMSLRLGYYY
jgi:hypothetical protein